MAAARSPWTILVLLMLLSATNQLHRQSLPAVADQVMRDHAIGEEAMGDLGSVFYYTYTLLMAAGGWLADRVGTRRTLLIVAAGSGVFGALCGFTGWLALAPAAAWWWLAAARGGLGVTSAPIYPSCARTVASWFEARRHALANGLVIAAAPVGMIAANLVMSRLTYGTRLGWRGAFIAVGIATFAVLLLWAALGRAAPTAALTSPRRGDWSKVLRHRGILALTLSYATVGYFEYLLFYWLKYYLKAILKLDEDESAAYSALPFVFMAVLTPLGGWACGRMARRHGLKRGLRLVPVAAMGLAAAFLAAGALVPHLLFKVLLLSLALGAIGASEGPFWTAAVMLGGPQGGMSGGFVNTGGNLLGALAPLLTPRIAGWINGSTSAGGAAGDPLLGWTVALCAGSIVCIMGMVFWIWVDVEKPIEGS